MTSKLKNYTSTSPAANSISRIEANLVKAGATDIAKNYAQGVCAGITFRIMAGDRPVFFKLPAKSEACFKVLWKEVKTQSPAREKTVRAQAERTAWKIVSDWVDIQLSMLILAQAEVIELFLPYVYDPASETTFYEQVKEKNFKLLNQ